MNNVAAIAAYRPRVIVAIPTADELLEARDKLKAEAEEYERRAAHCRTLANALTLKAFYAS